MSKQIKFSVGNVERGYKSVEICVDGDKVTYKILRNEFKPVDKTPKVVTIDRLEDFDALDIFAWEKNYVGDKTSDDLQWSLTLRDGDKIYRGRGSNAFPAAWNNFLDWLDALVPEMKFIDGNRIDGIELILPNEFLSLTRGGETLTIEKISSTHTYSLGAVGTKDFLDVCQKFFDALEVTDDTACKKKIFIRLNRHDETTTEFSTPYSEFAVPGVVKFADEIHEFAADLAAEIFAPENIRRIDADKIILCKVQFSGNYKSYTYRAEDETFTVGDIVDVPVGRNNDVTQARIVDIGYFDAQDAPLPLDRIKTIIGKHAGNAWENY